MQQYRISRQMLGPKLIGSGLGPVWVRFGEAFALASRPPPPGLPPRDVSGLATPSWEQQLGCCCRNRAFIIQLMTYCFVQIAVPTEGPQMHEMR